MQFPRVHLNGTDGRTLLEEYLSSARKVLEAINAVFEIEVHDRDYYVISPEAGATARREHLERLNAMRKVYADLMAIAENIDEQIVERESKS